MPHIEIKLLPGYGEEKKQKLVQSILRDVAGDLEIPERVVSIAFEEVPSDQWQQKVYEPLIADRDGLVKAPEYK